MTKFTYRVAVTALLLSAGAQVAMAQTAAPQTTPPTAVAPVAPVAAKADQRSEPSAEEKAVRAKFRAACSADIAKFCPEATPAADATPDQVKAARGKTRVCLTTNAANVSADCKTAMVEREKAYEAKKN
jgi:hypothetical protein